MRKLRARPVVTPKHRLAARQQKAVLAAVQSGAGSLRAETPQTLSDWARDHFKLVGESSHQKGGWEAWPFQLGWMDAFSNDEIESVTVQKSKRVGYTKSVVAFIAYNVAHRRRKQAVWQPTDDDRDQFVKAEVDPALDTVPAVVAARRAGSQRASTIGFKPFRDSVLYALGGKAARAYRRITVAVAILDEWDGFDQVVEKSSDPGTLARGRLEGAPYPKFVGGSTPRVRGLSHTERARLAADVDLRYCITCPHCGIEHPLAWGGKGLSHGFKWDKGRPETVRHVCPHCRGSITQGEYLEAWVGEWVCQRTGARYSPENGWRNLQGEPVRAPRHVAFQIWAGYSPQRAWPDIVREFEAAHATLSMGDTGPMAGFVNETLGETWEVDGDRIEHHVLQQRAERYDLGWCPRGVLKLTCGIDVQSSGRWELSVWGWGRGMESWLVAHTILEGNPAVPEDWHQVAAYLDRSFPVIGYAGTLGIDSTSIDSSNDTQAVYAFVREQSRKRRIQAIKGLSEPGKPIKCPATLQDVDWKGQRFPRGVKLWGVGVDTAKDLLHGQLAILPNEPGPTPGCVHFSDELQREFFEQLTAEQRILKRTPRGEAHVWVKRRARNEVLDCRNYATHAAYMLGLDRYTDAQWIAVEAVVHQLPIVDDTAPRPLIEPTPPARKPTTRPPTPQRPAFGRAW